MDSYVLCLLGKFADFGALSIQGRSRFEHVQFSSDGRHPDDRGFRLGHRGAGLH